MQKWNKCPTLFASPERFLTFKRRLGTVSPPRCRAPLWPLATETFLHRPRLSKQKKATRACTSQPHCVRDGAPQDSDQRGQIARARTFCPQLDHPLLSLNLSVVWRHFFGVFVILLDRNIEARDIAVLRPSAPDSFHHAEPERVAKDGAPRSPSPRCAKQGFVRNGHLLHVGRKCALRLTPTSVVPTCDERKKTNCTGLAKPAHVHCLVRLRKSEYLSVNSQSPLACTSALPPSSFLSHLSAPSTHRRLTKVFDPYLLLE